MSVIATAVKHLIAAGVTGDALVAAIAEMEANYVPTVDPVAERRRAYDRERKRAAKLSTGIPPESTESAETAPLSLPPNEKISNPPTHTPENIPHARKADDFPCPVGVDSTDWQALKANRKAKRAPLTAGAHRAITRKLDGWARDGWPPGPIVATAAERGWTTVFETDEMKAPRNGTNRTAPPRPDSRSGFAKALDDFLDHDPCAASQPANGAHRRAMGDGGSDRDGPVASVITLRPDSVRVDHSDIAGRAAHAGYR